MNMEINKLKLEIKAKEEDLLVNKLNDDKVTALNTQKISLLEKECEQWKERYNLQSKELSENKNNILNLNSEIDKLKSENRNLKMKQGVAGVPESVDNKKLGPNNNFFPNNTTNAIGRDNILGNSRLLIELLSGQNAIKDYLKELMNKTDDLVNKNKDLVIKNKKLTCSLSGNKNSSNNNSFNSSTNSSSNNLISSNKINVVELNELYRQGKDSNILTLAYDVREGIVDEKVFNNDSDLTFIKCSDNEVMKNIMEISDTLLPSDRRFFSWSSLFLYTSTSY